MSALQYPWPETPAPGETIEVAPGIHWLSMPLPFALDHINLWLMRDEEGWAIVDTGIGNAETRALWDKILPRFQPVRRIVLTHYHPDHAGNADWLCKRYGVELWTTQGEYLTAHAVAASAAGYTTEAGLNVFRRNGLDDARSAAVSGLQLHHRRRFDELWRQLGTCSRSAGELLPVIFRRPLAAHQTFFAMGEAIAHLHYLYYAGVAKRTAGPDGIMRYAAR